MGRMWTWPWPWTPNQSKKRLQCGKLPWEHILKQIGPLCSSHLCRIDLKLSSTTKVFERRLFHTARNRLLNDATGTFRCIMTRFCSSTRQNDYTGRKLSPIIHIVSASQIWPPLISLEWRIIYLYRHFLNEIVVPTMVVSTQTNVMQTQKTPPPPWILSGWMETFYY